MDPNVPCLFKHRTRNVTFSLVVDDFGIKYIDKTDADHLISTLQLLYEIKIDWTGSKYLGYSIRFSPDGRTVTLSMPDYIPKVLTRFCSNGVSGASTPAIYTPPQYGQKGTPSAPLPDTSPPLSPSDILTLQEIVGCFLFYARAVDSLMLTAINNLSSQQSHATANTMTAARRLLAYAASHPNAELIFTASDMILHVQSDAAYLARPDSQSLAGGLHYLGIPDPTFINGAIHNLCATIPAVVSSAGEAEYGALFMNAQQAEYERTILTALGHPQPPTTILTDNDFAQGLANDSIKQKCSKAILMRYHWVRDRVRLNHFNILWRKGELNLADFFTKPLPVHQHQRIAPFLITYPPLPTNPALSKHARRSHVHRASLLRPTQLLPFSDLSSLQSHSNLRGCVDT
jgi:hypothetical protein